MSRERIPTPVCANCNRYLRFLEDRPRKQHGVMMSPGERFCLGSKRVRRYRHSDPKIYVPSWCPRRKTPCELRVYAFKNQNEAAMHHFLSLALGHPISPMAGSYAVEHDLTTILTPKEFWNGCYHHKSDAELVGTVVHQYYIVEVDDGIQPVCFYKVDGKYQILYGFNTEKARKNLL